MLTLLDGRTLFFAGALVAGAFAPIMFIRLRISKTYPGFRSWAFSELAFSVLFFMQAIRGLTLDVVPVLVGNLSVCGAMILLNRGICQFCDKKEMRATIYGGSLLYLGGIYYFFFVHENFRIRTLLAGSYLALMAIHCSWPLIRRSPARRRFGYGFSAAILLFGGIVGFVRVIGIASVHNPRTLFSGRPIDTVFFLTDLIFIVGVTFSFFLLTNERSVEDLRVANEALGREIAERERAEIILRHEVDEREKLECRLKEMVNTDALTGVLSRRGWMAALENELRRARRFGASVSLLLVDIDHFKHINDSYGHAAGDLVLSSLSRVFKLNVRTIDSIGRLGGDEFAILLPGTGLDGARIAAEKIRASIGQTPIDFGPVGTAITVSIGVAMRTQDDDDGEQLLADADAALYRAKENGRNCIASVSVLEPVPNRK